MIPTATTDPILEGSLDLAQIMAQFRNDPLGFVLWAYPWGKPGTELAEEYPDRWQIAVLEDIRMALEKNESLPAEERIPIQIAIASGHGIGKTALIAWINHWFMSTNVDPQCVTTANTENQLSTKTWRELRKWHRLSVHEHLFEWTATTFKLKERPETWCANAIPWSKDRPESFAGTHAEAVLYTFDEGSAIIDEIYDVSEGAMTSGRCIWIVFGNPTRNTGRFRACFGKFRHRWITRSIDARTARKTNKAKIKQWIDDYGLDSDFVRVRVLGRFPKQASNQLIAESDVERCMGFEALGFEMYPISICVDVARFGEDLSTIGAYQGRKCHELKGYSGKNVVETSTLAAEAYRFHRARVPQHIKIRIFVDDVGVGGGVVDVLKTWGLPVTGVNSGSKSSDPERFLNMRAQMWWRGREAVQAGFDLRGVDNRLKDDLCNLEYFMTASQKIQIEAVDDLKARGLPSPDYGTNFVLQFAYPQVIDIIDQTARGAQHQRPGAGSTTMQKRREQGYGVGRNTQKTLTGDDAFRGR